MQRLSFIWVLLWENKAIPKKQFPLIETLPAKIRVNSMQRLSLIWVLF